MVLSRREELEQEVRELLGSAADGRIAQPCEKQHIDFKEEAGRRSGGHLEPGARQNLSAATKLADEVACMANTPGGGALILGVEDATGALLGTQLDQGWLRQRVRSAVDVAPDIVEEHVDGQRLLVIYVAEAREPVQDTGNRLRWRVGDSCQAVDRSEWWQHRDKAAHLDPMAPSSRRLADEADPGAVRLARTWAGADASLTDPELLRTWGAVRSDGYLSEAGALLFIPQGRSGVELTVLDVPGGSVLHRAAGDPGTTVLEQLATVETSLDAVNTMVTREAGLGHQGIRRVPRRAAREAILNGLIHRDWNRTEPTDVRWITEDSTLVVRSPGGFFGSVSEENVLSNRDARYPALADLFRAIGLVEKQGVGVDRMYQSMIVLGHRPPTIHEIAGSFIECSLTGGAPVYPIKDLVDRIVPSARRDDYRVAIIIFLLLHSPFITEESVADGLQSTPEAARQALETTRQTTVDAEPLISRYKHVWVFGKPAFDQAVKAHDPQSAFPLLDYATTDSEALQKVVAKWFETTTAITSGDLATISHVSRGTAKRCLDEMVADQDLVLCGAGRSTRYEATPKFR